MSGSPLLEKKRPPDAMNRQMPNKQSSNPKISVAVLIGLSLAIVIDTALQISWKFAALSIPDGPMHWSWLAGIVTQPIFLGVGLLLLLQLVNWIKVLAKSDLSYAQPITSLSNISVAIASAEFLDEKITLLKIIGIAIILGGVWLISKTKHRTDVEPDA
jgi:drug/metabolite transporter (DMT)-like permease